MKYCVVYLFMMMASVFEMKAGVDPKFHIYLCFGQSNMAGGSRAESIDLSPTVDSRFKMLAARDYALLNQTTGNWYAANPPLVPTNNPNTVEKNICVADYFGRSMVAALPSDYKVGVINVAIGGVEIRYFMSEWVKDHLNFNTSYLAAYGNDPYKRLVDMAKIAQQSGVIKGILLHQGEADNGREEWPQRVKTIYDRLITDLGLNAAKVPLLVGEVVNASEEGSCAGHNNVIAKVPTVIPTAHVISSAGCPCAADKLHFTPMGYRIMGKRYAIKMLELLGYPAHKDANYSLSQNLRKFYKATSLKVSGDINLSVNNSYTIPVTAEFEDGHKESVSAGVAVTSIGNSLTIDGTVIKAVTNERSKVIVKYTDFTDNTLSTSFYVNKSVFPTKFIKEIVNYIMGKPSSTFNKNSADANGDKVINAADIVHIISAK